MASDGTPPESARPSPRLLLRIALVVSSLFAVISAAAAAYYIPHMRIYPACMDIVK